MDLYLPRKHLIFILVYDLPNLGTHFYAVNAVTTDGKFSTRHLRRKQDIYYDGIHYVYCSLGSLNFGIWSCKLFSRPSSSCPLAILEH